MRDQKYQRFWGGICVICRGDWKEFTTSKEHPHSIFCDDCKINRSEEYELRRQSLENAEGESRRKGEKEREETEERYYKELEEEEEHYQFLADNHQESYDDWLSSEFGDDAGSAYWNNE